MLISFRVLSLGYGHRPAGGRRRSIESRDGGGPARELPGDPVPWLPCLVRSIIAAPFPGLRAVEALATSVPLFLLLFAATYVVMATLSASNFSQPLTRTDALYFTVTMFGTVGFGDITAKPRRPGWWSPGR